MPIAGVLLSALSLGAAAFQASLISPEVRADRTVTFRFRDPGAKKVELSLEGSDAIPMERDATGVWSVTTDALAPDLYGYSFNSDGNTRLDPLNPITKPNLIWPGNMVLVPGAPPQPWEVRGVAHGTVHHHFYRSGVVGDERDYFVYTPPGYRVNDRTKYPVLYLLHGYSDMANGWTAIGKANVILDNLIADGKAKPMVVVMPLGYGVTNFASPTQGFRDPALVTRNYADFSRALLTEVLPQVEKEYRVSTSRSDRAIAGLSMGGAESLLGGLNNLDRFSYVGAFSSGGLRSDFPAAFPALKAAEANKKLKLLWISCGTDDGLIGPNRQLVTWLKGQGVQVSAHETPGRHAWMVWRRNLADLAQLLFR